ncbi:MAG: hypothetical protein Q8O46_02305 [bacterium]|nr:hypothetical protein [bacterium]
MSVISAYAEITDKWGGLGGRLKTKKRRPLFAFDVLVSSATPFGAGLLDGLQASTFHAKCKNPRRLIFDIIL